MSPRREVNSLLSISLQNIDSFVQGIIKTVAPEIVRYHNECTKKDLDSERNYRREMLNEYVERLREHIFSHVPYSIVEDVKNKVSTEHNFYHSSTTYHLVLKEIRLFR